jgi:hypothetical protein
MRAVTLTAGDLHIDAVDGLALPIPEAEIADIDDRIGVEKAGVDSGLDRLAAADGVDDAILDRLDGRFDVHRHMTQASARLVRHFGTSVGHGFTQTGPSGGHAGVPG